MNKVYIDPNDVKGKLDYNLFYKECFLLFSVLVAGKSSESIKHKTNALVYDIIGEDEPESLFILIKEKYSDNNFEPFLNVLKKHKTGKYSLLIKFINDVTKNHFNLMSCSIEELESITGIGKKSSRFFMLYNRKDCKDIAVLDTHILKFLSKNGYDVPEQTPSGKKYDEIEKIFVNISKKLIPSISIYDLDFKLWYNAKMNKNIPKIIDNRLVFDNEDI